MAVHRFKAGESKEQAEVKTKAAPAKVKKTAPKKAVAKSKVTKEKVVKLNEDGTRKRNVFIRLGQYFKGSWVELRQVHWPNRKQTWQLTLAVILFSLLIGAIIFALDALFTWLFKEVIL